MQYWQRRLQRSVTEMRKLRSGRPRRSCTGTDKASIMAGGRTCKQAYVAGVLIVFFPAACRRGSVDRKSYSSIATANPAWGRSIDGTTRTTRPRPYTSPGAAISLAAKASLNSMCVLILGGLGTWTSTPDDDTLAVLAASQGPSPTGR